MKKLLIVSLAIGVSMLLVYCNPSKKAAASGKEEAAKIVVKSTYESGTATVIMNNCSPCHIPAKGGRVTPLDTYDKVKANIDEIIRRVELTPGSRGFMPAKKTEKLNDSTINVLKLWKTDGLLEK